MQITNSFLSLCQAWASEAEPNAAHAHVDEFMRCMLPASMLDEAAGARLFAQV